MKKLRTILNAKQRIVLSNVLPTVLSFRHLTEIKFCPWTFLSAEAMLLHFPVLPKFGEEERGLGRVEGGAGLGDGEAASRGDRQGSAQRRRLPDEDRSLPE